MNKLTSCLVILITMFSLSSYAEDKSLEEQIDEIKIMLEREQIRNIELKVELAKKEQEADELREKLRNIEDEIDTLKAQHNLN